MPLKHIVCRGTPYEIGRLHGTNARDEIARAVEFYAKLFTKHSKLSWPEVQALASDFDGVIQSKWPRYYQELKGWIPRWHYATEKLTCRDLKDIIALNVRTEIVFGQFSDGCTSLYYHGGGSAYMGQNWDWMEEQAVNLVHITIIQDALPTIEMITEAGMIGKIGLNDCGVGVCFNAIRAKGMDKTRVPVHLGLRIALESKSTAEAVDSLERIGMASPGHFLIGDPTTAVGLEFTSTTFARVPVNQDGFVVHSNHMLLPHADVYEPKWLEDSPVRIETMERNIRALPKPLEWPSFSSLFEDESNYPTGICRACGTIRMGRPVRGEQTGKHVELSFDRQ
ncbi:acyl-coenzyme A:6-aminopenicillanic acid acyl-transferase-domain-containing protein [Aspergillus floccosus]